VKQRLTARGREAAPVGDRHFKINVPDHLGWASYGGL